MHAYLFNNRIVKSCFIMMFIVTQYRNVHNSKKFQKHIANSSLDFEIVADISKKTYVKIQFDDGFKGVYDVLIS